MLPSYEGVVSLLAIRREVTAIELVTMEALIHATMRSLEHREGKTGKAAGVHLVQDQTCRGANGIAVVGKFDVPQMRIPIVFALISYHG